MGSIKLARGRARMSKTISAITPMGGGRWVVDNGWYDITDEWAVGEGVAPPPGGG